MATSRTSRPALAADAGQPHIVLVGLPGAGKSAVGALLGEALGRPVLDFDVEISRRAGLSIQEIFARRGEEHFREMERALTEELRGTGNMILAPGGGWVTRAETVALIRPPARLVYLKVTPGTAMRRMGAGMADRPLLRHPDPVGELGRLLAVRGSAYEGADLVLDVEDLAPQEVTHRIAMWAT